MSESPCSGPPRPSYYFTVRLRHAGSDLLVREIRLLRHCVRLVRQIEPFLIDAAVVLPSRMHMIWTLPAGDTAYGPRWHQIKTIFANHIPEADRIPNYPGIWQRRYWERPIRSAGDRAEFLDAILSAPVDAGLVSDGRHWRYSSFWTGPPPPPPPAPPKGRENLHRRGQSIWAD